ncbi:MAG: hypothetical protein ACFBSC_06630 [Microcoleaceae cyanobacterium]
MSALDLPFQRLREIRNNLLKLHKALLDSEKVTYERFHGRIRTQGEFLRLVLEDDWFSWLRPFSKFIVQIDEALEAKEPMTLEQANQLLQEAEFLLRASENGTLREKRYYEAIQRDPDIAFIHAATSGLLNLDR